MGKIKAIIQSILLVVLTFYVIYPVALPLFGFSFIFTSGMLGLGLYVYSKFPFSEVVSLILLFFVMIGWALFCAFVNPDGDTFIFEHTKSQMAWLFSGYLIVFLFFKLHPQGSFRVLVYYIIAAITLQGAISVAMYLNPEVSAFFDSIAMSTELSIGKRASTEGKRLLGYGIAFFGAGIIYGVSLLLITYVFMSKKTGFLQQLFWAILFVATTLVGLLSARTTAVGLFASLILMVILFFKGKESNRSQAFSMMFYCVIFVFIGVSIVYALFDDFAEWAFEPFLNYQRSGEFRTESSDGLTIMFTYPTTAMEWIFGWGKGNFWGSDVGFTRLLYWFGIPGTLLFFGYSYLLLKQGFTSDKVLNLTLLAFFAYNLALNVKGLSDLNQFGSMFAMYFLYYRYYIYTPYLYRIGKLKQTTLRDAFQSPSSGRRV